MRRDAAARKLRICWRYILFSHNDSIEEIEHAQRLADGLGLDEMMFVLTHTWNRSTKYTTQEQLDSAPEFKVFTGQRKTFRNVNLETNNIEHWAELGMRERAARFVFHEER